VLFVVGSMMVPGLWDYAEYLFPGVLAVLLALGVWALKL